MKSSVNKLSLELINIKNKIIKKLKKKTFKKYSKSPNIQTFINSKRHVMRPQIKISENKLYLELQYIKCDIFKNLNNLKIT